MVRSAKLRAARLRATRRWESRNPDRYLEARRKIDARRASRPSRIAWTKAFRNKPEQKAKRKLEMQRYLESHPEYRARKLENTKAWNRKNRLKINAYRRNRRKTNPSFLIEDRIRARMRDALKRTRQNKNGSTKSLLGCSIPNFRIYLESLFEPGMSWQNYGEWHIDHIMPCAIFDLAKPDHQRRCFHFSNQRPLWASDNLSRKRAKYVGTNQP